MRIDPERYFSRGFMRREQEALWPRAWLMAAHDTELRLGPVELACANVLVLVEAAGAGQPRARQVASAEPVRCEAWAGFVWVNLDADAPDLRTSLGAARAPIEAYETASWSLESHVTTELRCNWKASVDAHNEGYHVHALHSEVLPVVDDVNQRVELLGDHASIFVTMGRPSPRLPSASGLGPELSSMLRAEGLNAASFHDATAARHALQSVRRRRVPDGLSDDQLTDNHHYYLFPNLQLSLYAEHALVFRHRPVVDEPERTNFDQLVLRRGPAGVTSATSATERVRRVLPNDKIFGKVTGADLALLPNLQRGLRSRGFRGPLLSSAEKAISGMHAALDRWLPPELGPSEE